MLVGREFITDRFDVTMPHFFVLLFKSPRAVVKIYNILCAKTRIVFCTQNKHAKSCLSSRLDSLKHPTTPLAILCLTDTALWKQTTV